MSVVDANLLDYITHAIALIGSDKALKTSFIRILGANPAQQKDRVSALTQILIVNGAPEDLRTFVKLLGNDQVAAAVLKALTEI